jgi:hypothetical protein
LRTFAVFALPGCTLGQRSTCQMLDGLSGTTKREYHGHNHNARWETRKARRSGLELS